MENKQKPAAESEDSICSDLEQLNLADFALGEVEAKSSDGTAGEIEKMKAELAELMKKEMEAMKLASKADSNEIANKFDGKIDRLEKYMNDQFQKLAQENQKQGKKEDKSLEGKLAKSEQAMGKLKKEIDRKNEKLAEKDKEIFALEVEIVGLKREIGQNDQKMEKKAEEICALKEEIGQKDQKLAEQEAKIVALENEIDGQKAKIGQKDQKLAEQEAKIVALENEIAKQKKVVDQQSTIGNAKIERLLPPLPSSKIPPPIKRPTQPKLPPPPSRWTSYLAAINSSNAKPTKTPTVGGDANKTGPKKDSNLYGYCAGCEQGFLRTDWVHQVGDLLYHAVCFKCEFDNCRRQLIDFNEFLLDYIIPHKNRALGKMVPQILCPNHYNSSASKMPITEARLILVSECYVK